MEQQAKHQNRNFFLRMMPFRHILVCLLILGIFSAVSGSESAPAQANASLGTVAYILPNTDTGDEIHLIDLDTLTDSLLWKTNVPGEAMLQQITGLAWKPDATELAFTSSHEENCSLYQADTYAIRSDGQDYRRVSGPPACGNPNHLPTGTVRVPVENWTATSGPFTIYFEGAPGPFEIALGPNQSTTLTFTNVADYGDQQQYAVAAYGEVRSFYPGAKADVKPGTTVEAGVLVISTGLTYYGFQWPTYNPDGSQIASIFRKDELYQVESDNRDPGYVGGPLPVNMPISSDFLAWGPTAERANQFLYEGWQDSDTIFLGDLDTESSELILTIDPTRIGKTLLGLAWLPDGSGFLYTYTEMVNYVYKADLFEYSFATGQSTRLTNLSSGFIRRLTISPDGQLIVFEWQASGDWYETNPSLSLGFMAHYGDTAYILADNGRAPAFAPAALPEPVVLDHSIFIPFVRKP